MFVDHIIRELKDLKHMNDASWSNTHKNKRDAERHRALLGCACAEDLSDALWGLDQAMDAMTAVTERVNLIIDMIEMEALSAKVQSK